MKTNSITSQEEAPLDEVRFYRSNENPYGVSRAARIAMNNSYDVAHLYGGSGRRELAQVIANNEGISTENILITAGSSEILHTMALIVGIEGGSILAPDPTFDNNFMKYADCYHQGDGRKCDESFGEYAPLITRQCSRIA